MAVSLAGVELSAVSMMRAAEDRHLVRHHLPGFEGDVLQDLGRGPSMFTIHGLLQGDQAFTDAESLRGKFRDGTPVELAAALATTLEVQQVVIRTLELREQAGWPSLIHIRVTVIEYIEPPTPGGFGLGGLIGLASVAFDSAVGSWGDQLGGDLSIESFSRQIINDPASANSLLAEAGTYGGDFQDSLLGDVGGRLAGDTGLLGGFLQALPGASPDLFGAIAGALTGQPGALQNALTAVSGSDLGSVLEHVAAGDLAGAIAGAASSLGGDQMSQLLRSVGADPTRFGEIVSTLVQDPAAALSMVGGVMSDPGVLPGILGAVPEFLSNIDPNDLGGSIAENLQNMIGSEVTDLLSSVTGLDIEVAGDLINALADADSLQDVAKILAEEGMEFLEDATGIELRTLYNAADALFNGGDFIQKVKNVIASGKAVFNAVKDLDPLADLNRLWERRP